MLSSINIDVMKTFKQYLSEIFRPNKTHDLIHPDLVGADEGGVVTYKHSPKDEKGNLIEDDEVVTTFTPNKKNSWEVIITRGGYADRPKNKRTNNFPDLATKAFDHFDHFVQTQKNKTGVSPTFTYDTASRIRDRIYKKAFKRLGVKAWNTLVNFDDE